MKTISKPVFRYLLALAAAMVTFVPLNAQMTLASVLADHMVLQRRAPIHIWGWSSQADQIHVEFNGVSAITTASDLGTWSLYLPPEEAGGPYVLKISDGQTTIRREDILVGDVWVASGQSNMEIPIQGWANYPVKDSASEIAASDHPEIRIARVARTSSAYPIEDIRFASPWSKCGPDTVSSFSAVAYFFARDLQVVEKIPIGVIQAAWGGTPAEAWTSMAALSSDASLMPLFSLYANLTDDHTTDLRRIAREKNEDDQLKKEGLPLPHRNSHTEILAWQPGALFNGMIAPLTLLPIKGVIWYQGEANADPTRSSLYERSFSTLIRDWRQKWGQGAFPFLYVQISAFGRSIATPWSVTREAQRRALALTNTAMVVSADVGDPNNVHPPDKQTVGKRLALAARSLAYGDTVEFSGPTPNQQAFAEDSVRIWFDHARGLHFKNGRSEGFEIAGANREFAVANATIDGDSIIVSSPKVHNPLYVRYAWAAYPMMSIYNGDDLPAAPFNTDDKYRNQIVSLLR